MNNIIVGISGASGAIYADQLLTFLKNRTNHSVLIMATPNGKRIFQEELHKSMKIYGYPVVGPNDFNIPCVSGSAAYNQMVVVPCSMGSLARIAHGISQDNLSRSADVMLKEKKQLIIVPRETPFSLIHLRNMTLLSEAGATIIPAIPSFYSQPSSVEEVAATVTARILDHLGIQNDLMPRWPCAQ